jgi:hypothetical protein
MLQRVVAGVAWLAMAAVVAGCSGVGAGMEAFHVGKNLRSQDTNLRVFLDGEQATQNKLAKGLKGYAKFEIKKPVSTSPVFRYEIIDPKKFGFIKTVSLAVHQKFEADFSDLADYKIFSKSMDSEKQMQPNKDYDLAKLGADYKILDKKDKEVSQVKFVPGVDYLLVFTVAGDKSETIQVYFKTK